MTTAASAKPAPTPKNRSAGQQPRAPENTTALAHARVQRGLSLRKVAEDLKISKTTLSRIEKGESVPSRTQARQLYAYYDKTVALADIYDATFNLIVSEREHTVDTDESMTFEELNTTYAHHKAQTGHDFVTKTHMITGSTPQKPYGCDICYRLAVAYGQLR